MPNNYLKPLNREPLNREPLNPEPLRGDMADQDKDQKDKTEKKRQRDDSAQPVVLPGIHRYQFFSNLKDRALTKNLNRLMMFGIITTLGVDIIKPLFRGLTQTIYCYECRACYATQDNCPVGIPFQAELFVASRVSDYRRFINNGGLKCVRCGNCTSFCVQYIELQEVFGQMQTITMDAIRKGKVPKGVLVRAMEEGLVGRDFIADVADVLGKRT